MFIKILLKRNKVPERKNQNLFSALLPLSLIIENENTLEYAHFYFLQAPRHNSPTFKNTPKLRALGYPMF